MTLFDLARELNVSISTISRALSRPEMVAPGTREKVLAAVKQSGFQPNEIARSLRTRETKTIGIIVPDITNWFFGVIVKAVGEVAKSNGYSVLVCNADEDPSGEEHALNLLRDRKASGIINCPMSANLSLWRGLKKTGIPVVEFDRVSGLEKSIRSFSTANSEMAGGAIGALRECKIKIPAQLSVVAVDDARWARYLDPPLTVIAQPTEAMGRCAAELLIARMTTRSKSGKPHTEVFPPELILRKSTAPLRRSKSRLA
jgi:DNA-binding LacI/PurR family transcriptional regulator